MFMDLSAKYFITILSVTLLTLLSSCSPSPQELREQESGKQVTFTAPENYQSVYRKILIQARKCYQTVSTFSTENVEVDGDLFNDTKSGSITVIKLTGGRRYTEVLIDISAIDDQQTKVDIYFQPRRGVYTSIDNVDNEGLDIKRWYITQSKECD